MPSHEADDVRALPGCGDHGFQRTRLRIWKWNPEHDEVIWSGNPDQMRVAPSSGVSNTVAGFLRTVHPDDRDRLQRAMSEATESGREVAVEFRVRQPDGQVVWLIWEGHAVAGAGSPCLAGVGMEISEYRQTAERLHERSELLFTTLRSIGDGVITTDRHGRVTFVNPVAEELSGWSNEEAQGLPSEEVFQIVNEETRIKVESPVHKVLKEGTIVGLANHTVLIGKDGGERPIDDSGAPIKDASGSILGTVLVFRDVTERRRVDQALQRLAAIVESSDDAIVSKDLNGIVTSWNRAAERIYGYSAEEMIGRSKARVIPADLPNELTNILEKIRRGERIEHYETSRIRKDGVRIELSISVSPILDRDGRVVGASTIARDITETKRRERAIRESENRLTGILQSAMDGIITIDEEQRIVFFNAAAERMFRVRAEAASGQPIGRFIPARYRATHGHHIQRFGDTGVTTRSMGVLGAISGVRADGEEFPIEASISQTEVEGRKIFTVILRDITERLRAEEAREQHQQEIETLNEQLRRSMRETHHRVRNSLQLIAALTDMQMMDGSKMVPATELKRIESQVHALAAVHEILTKEANTRTEVNDLSACEMMERLVELLQKATPGRAIATELEDFRITAKQGSSLAVVVNELVTNAMKYSDGPVSVRMLRNGTEATLEVLDQGAGFAPDFEPDAAQNTGLALVRHISEWDLRGAIAFGTGPNGRGGRAVLTIPLEAPR